MMNITIVGLMSNLKLSPNTINAFNVVDSLETTEKTVTLILADSKLPLQKLVVPKYTNIINFQCPSKMDHYSVIENYLTKNESDLIIVCLDDDNESLVPLLGDKLQAPSYIDITTLELNKTNNTLEIIKPEYGGNVNAHYILDTQSVISFRHHPAQSLLDNDSVAKDVKTVITACTENKQILSVTSRELANSGIADAKVIIVCGFGVGSKENIKKILQYGNKIGAIVCGTKKIIDSGWLPLNLLIGQTGHIISPDICITIGVSGAAPLLNGILGSKIIIAINKDKDARIFNYADYGIVKDYNEILKEGFDLL